MAKITKDISGALFPTPVVLVTTVDTAGKPNIITLAWVGIVCSNPFTLSVAIRPSRYSHALLEAVPELVVNVPTKEIVASTDYCGTVSGRSIDKFAACGFTAIPADEVRAPLIQECPINLECRVTNTLSLGTHDVFISQVAKVHVDEGLVDESGKVDHSRVAPFVYLDMDYWTLAEKIGRYGYSKKG
ncbi:MAG: flavin reductase family protein [Actinomycetota bacterium]|nr:flavin reductase family protein [Actinomycetota bacterium]